MQTDYSHYALRRDVAAVAKFVNAMASHRAKLAAFNLSPANVKFPVAPSKNSKYPAYEAASRIERELGLESHASSVPELAALLGVALQTTL